VSVRVVTGASSGIGAAIARALAEPGTTLVLHGRNEAALATVADEVRAAGAEAQLRTADLAREEAVRALVATLPERIDLLVHSAGVARLGRVEELSADDLDAQWTVNVRAPALLTRAALPRLRAAGGLVVFVNSGAGQRAKAGWGGYAASKFALRALADALREEESGNGVRVTSVYPGRVATPMQRSVREQEGGAYRPDDYLRPEEVAQVVADVARLPAHATVPDVSVRPG
jgi:NADP-dependent 3-hydroxy acid dehydrogenase YdfG